MACSLRCTHRGGLRGGEINRIGVFFETSGSNIMTLQECVERRIRLGILIATASVCAVLLLPQARAAQPGQELRTFSEISNGTSELVPAADAETVQWVLHSGETSEVDRQLNANVYWAGPSTYAADTGAQESFAHVHRVHHGRIENGWDGEIGFGENRQGECIDGCVGTSAVPEPTRPSLIIAGVILLVIVIKRRPDVALLGSRRGNARRRAGEFPPIGAAV
jgi:hypothetical protein